MSGGKESIKIAMTLSEAVASALNVQVALDEKAIRNEICGSVRRGKSTGIGDIDMVVARPVSDAVDVVFKWTKKKKIPFALRGLQLTKESRLAVFTIRGIPFNFYGAHPEQWGAMVLFLTGSQLFNIIMRGEAKKQGYKLNQYGLWLGDDQIAGKTEEQMFDALGLEYVEPKDRSIDAKNKNILKPLRRTD